MTYQSILIALLFNVTDLVSGLFVAVRKKDIQSCKLRDGMFKKAGFILCYFMGWLVDNHGNLIGFQLGMHVLPAVILYACTTELVSILENVSELNPDILPKKLYQLFHISNNEEGEQEQ